MEWRKEVRLRIMELPSVVVGPDVRTPFVFVLDEVSEGEVEVVQADSEAWRGLGGSEGLLFFRGHVVLPGMGEEEPPMRTITGNGAALTDSEREAVRNVPIVWDAEGPGH